MIIVRKKNISSRKVLKQAGSDFDDRTPGWSDSESSISWVTADKSLPGRAERVNVQITYIPDLNKTLFLFSIRMMINSLWKKWENLMQIY